MARTFGTSVAMLLVVLAACSSPEQDLPTATVRLSNGFRVREINVEIAQTDGARTRGLTGRRSVPDGTGMLFVYPRADAWGGFWMKDTFVPLDVAFVRDGTIFEIHTLQPCAADPCPLTTPAGLYDRVLEVRAGWLAAQAFTEGTRLEMLSARPSTS